MKNIKNIPWTEKYIDLDINDIVLDENYHYIF